MQETFYKVKGSVNKRIALISDLHEKPYDWILSSFQRQKPDMILICGDLINGRRPLHHTYKTDEISHILTFLRECADTAPVYYSLGNHERLLSPYDLKKIRETGVTVLDNAWVKTEDLIIGGLTSYKRDIYQSFKAQYHPGELYPHSEPSRMKELQEKDYIWLKEMEQQDGFKILLSHHPECWKLRAPYLCEYRFDLVLSGHAHGGQFRYYRNHAWHGLFGPDQGLFPEYTEGMHTGKYGSMIISRGCSNTAPHIPRLFNPLEIVYIDIGNL